MDVTQSIVQDPAAWDNVKVQPQTAWRVDRMRNMTYTQFWQLVKERRVDKVSVEQHCVLVIAIVIACKASYIVLDLIKAFSTDAVYRWWHVQPTGARSAKLQLHLHCAVCWSAGQIHVRQALGDSDHE